MSTLAVNNRCIYTQAKHTLPHRELTVGRRADSTVTHGVSSPSSSLYSFVCVYFSHAFYIFSQLYPASFNNHEVKGQMYLLYGNVLNVFWLQIVLETLKNAAY